LNGVVIGLDAISEVLDSINSKNAVAA